MFGLNNNKYPSFYTGTIPRKINVDSKGVVSDCHTNCSSPPAIYLMSQQDMCELIMRRVFIINTDVRNQMQSITQYFIFLFAFFG